MAEHCKTIEQDRHIWHWWNCGRITILNAAICESCGNLSQGRCAKIIRVTNRLVVDPRCMKCKEYHKNIVDQKETFHDDVETVTEFSYLGDGINSGIGCVTAVTSRTRLGWVNFGECQDLLCG